MLVEVGAAFTRKSCGEVGLAAKDRAGTRADVVLLPIVAIHKKMSISCTRCSDRYQKFTEDKNSERACLLIAREGKRT